MKILRYFHPLAPAYLAGGARHHKNSPDPFLDWYIRSGRLDQFYVSWSELPRSSKILALWGYYFWLFYLAAAIMVATFNPYVGVVAIILSPFITAGSVYTVLYTINMMKNASKKPARRNIKKP